MKVRDMCRKFECREGTHYKTQTGTSCEKCNSKAFRLGIEPASCGLLDQCSTTELQKALPFSIYINEMVMPVQYKGLESRLTSKKHVTSLASMLRVPVT